MNTPIVVGTDPIMIIARNPKRHKVFFKNIGVKNVYITRQPYSSIPNIPSANNFDILLGKDEEIEIESIAQFNAVVIQGNADKNGEGQTTELTVMETVYISGGI